MANLSNINNILRVSSSGVGLNKNNTGPSELDIESAGADMIDMTRTGLKTYRFAISGASAFSVFDVAANDDRLTINTSGNVGIGTSSPGTKLDIGGMADPVLRIKSDAGGDPELRFDAAAANRSARIKFYDNGSVVGGFIDYLHNGDKMNFGAGSSSGVTMTVGDGVVGIGTTSPKTSLDVVKDADIWHLMVGGATKKLLVGGQGTNGITIQGGAASTPNNAAVTTPYNISLQRDGGNVGIGTAAPAFRLEVISPTTNVVSRFTSQDNQAWISVRDDGYTTYGAMLGCDHDAGLEVILANNAATKRLVINNSGNVGIGTVSPSTKLEVEGNASTRNALANLVTLNGGDTVANPYDGFGVGLVFKGRDYSNAFRDYAYIYGVISGNTSSTTPAGDPGFKSELRFYTNTGGASSTLPTEKMVITSGGNVGIGNTTPGALLDVGPTIHPSANGIDVAAGAGGGNCIGLTTADNHNWFPYTNGNNYYSAANHVFRAGSTNSPTYMTITSTGAISLGTSATAYGTAGQVLTSNGNASPSWEDASGGSSPWTTSGNDIYNNNSGSVGVNNTSPSSHYSNYNQLVVGNGTNNQGMTIFAGSNDESSINFTDTTSTFSNNFIIKVDHNDPSESNNPSFQINYENNRYVTINKQTTGSTQVPQVRLGMFNSSSLPANLDHSMLEIGINNGMNNPGMVMYGDSQGNSNPFIGMVSTSGSSQIATKFFRFYHNTTLCGTIQKRYNANEVQYLTTSDYRLKEDLKPFKALDTICKINVYNYKWKNIEGYNVNYGVLAHELQELIPEVVAGEKDEVNKKGEEEYQSVDYSKLVPHLIQSIQELKADNDSLKARIETLENK